MKKLPNEIKFYEFEHATVQYRPDDGGRGPRLFVQAIDQYRYQRELNIKFITIPTAIDNKPDVVRGEFHIYQHPGRRVIDTASQYVVTKFLLRFLELCDDYPSLLFNAAGYVDEMFRPRHEGFVHFAENLHRTGVLSAKDL